MGQHRIICTNQEPAGQPPQHAHIVAVGIGDSTGYRQRLSSSDVMAAMDRGEVFYTQGDQSGKIALVHKVNCQSCYRPIIRSSPDAVHDNNLDSLAYCRI